jgi:hypothetical protein
MHGLIALFAFVATSAAAQTAPAPPVAMPAQAAAAWDPAASYITAGQDEPGYRSWYIAAPWRAGQVKSFNEYLATYQVAGILPTWQLLRTATAWQKCGAQPFEVPPTSEWPHIVQTLRYIHDYVIPAVGPVEAVSGYRNPLLNQCAGGAPESAHKHYSALDLVPMRTTSREELMRTLCSVHARRGTSYDVGLGFYAFLRFHVDSTKYRRWGTDPAEAASCPPIIQQSDIASVGYQAPPPTPDAPPPTQPAATQPAATVATVPSAPTQISVQPQVQQK